MITCCCNADGKRLHHCRHLTNDVENIEHMSEIPYTHNRPKDNPQNCQFPWGDLSPHMILDFLVPPYSPNGTSISSAIL